MYYTLDTSDTETVDGDCTGGDGTVDWADDSSSFVFTVDLKTKGLSEPITVDVGFTP